MHSIITFAYDVINVCVKCRHRQDCEWFQGAGEVVLENVTPDEYCELTQEQIAARIHADVPAPEDSCRQRSFDDMMAYLDEHLPTAEMPNTSDGLLNIHYQISQLRRRLVRIPEDCREVFDAPIRAIIDRCLAAIDYHCLMCHLDVIDFLKDSYKSYDRMKILRRDRVESVINILLSQAHKLTAEELLAYKGKFTDFKPDTSHAPAKADATKQDGTPFPAELQNAIPYLDVLKKHGLLDDNYRWTHKNNITNYHAAWASKIIIHNCPGATRNLIGQLIGINAPGTYVSLANAKESVKRLIEKLFNDEGLNVTMN